MNVQKKIIHDGYEYEISFKHPFDGSIYVDGEACENIKQLENGAYYAPLPEIEFIAIIVYGKETRLVDVYKGETIDEAAKRAAIFRLGILDKIIIPVLTLSPVLVFVEMLLFSENAKYVEALAIFAVFCAVHGINSFILKYPTLRKVLKRIIIYSLSVISCILMCIIGAAASDMI